MEIIELEPRAEPPRRFVRSSEIGMIALINPGIVTHETMTDPTDALLNDLESRPYTETRQLTYPDRVELKAAMHELQTSEGDSTIDTVMSLRGRFGAIGRGSSSATIRIAGRCNDRVDIKQDVQEVVEDKARVVEAILEEEPEAEVVVRNTTEKPRSKQFEEIEGENGKKQQIVPFCGYGINHPNKHQRRPNPKQLPAVNAQIRSVGEKLVERFGKHISTARESLSIPYMISMMRKTEDGRVYSAEADIIWLGDRTRQLDGLHVQILEELQPENVIGVKIGPSATAEDIIGLSKKLNPESIPGKLIYMFRMGKNNLNNMHPILEAVRDHAPESILMYDLHGATEKQKDGTKTRNVTSMIEETWILAAMCQKYGLKLHGTHIEAMGTDSKKQCIDDEDDQTDHQNIMDPQLNISQIKRYIRETAKVL